MKRLILHCLALLLLAPVTLYTAANCIRIGYSWLKYGWSYRPFIYIGVDGIVDFLIYEFLLILALGGYALMTKDKIAGVYASVAVLALIVYWLGFLTLSIGVSPLAAAAGPL